jgi:hypothetical protein
MQHVGAALAGAIVLLAAASASAQTSPPPMVMTMAPMPPASVAPASGAITTVPMPTGPLALDARSLRGARTPAGYRLTGQALVKDACTAARFARFVGNIFPPQFDIVQYRRPGTMGLMCIQRLTWVAAIPLNVTSAAPPRYVTARTQKGITRVPIR